MELLIGIAVATCLALLLALRLLIRKVAVAGGRLPVTAEWIDELSMERYLPMMRLLDGEDLDFLRSQPGFTPRMATKLRVQRCQIFRGYLRCLNADFGRVCAAIKVLMLQSRHDRPDLAAALVRYQVSFACGMLTVQIRLLFYRWGFCVVDVSNLVKMFDVMRMELRALVPATMPMNA
ncbi:MAG TPA: hypothetical protein VET69_15925 [Terriglobales bacterium]|nr:hypothetical protein [Terriglobales bacterium]